jgi:hypothetical protein
MESLLEQSDVARRKGRRWRKIRNIIFVVLFSGFVIWGAIRYYYPYAEGVKTGKLNYVVYKGLVFKTYEGKLIQSGIESSGSGDIQSNEFIFSVAEKDIAEKLMHAGGKTVELHYTEYFGAIPWRGCSRYVVDEIVSITEEPETPEIMDTVVNVASGIGRRYNCKF